MGEQLEAMRGLCAVCLRQTCDGKSCDWALGAPAPQMTALDRADIRRELVAREVYLAHLLARSVAHRAPDARQMLIDRLARVRELIALLAVLLLSACAASHGRIDGPPLYVHLCDSMPAADREIWGARAGDWNQLAGGDAVLWVGNGPPVGCDTVDVCEGEPGIDVGECVVRVRYEPGEAHCSAGRMLGLVLGLPEEEGVPRSVMHPSCTFIRPNHFNGVAVRELLGRQ